MSVINFVTERRWICKLFYGCYFRVSDARRRRLLASSPGMCPPI